MTKCFQNTMVNRFIKDLIKIYIVSVVKFRQVRVEGNFFRAIGQKSGNKSTFEILNHYKIHLTKRHEFKKGKYQLSFLNRDSIKSIFKKFIFIICLKLKFKVH
jgi:hypothetical protein